MKEYEARYGALLEKQGELQGHSTLHFGSTHRCSVKALTAALLGCILAGCGNAYEHLEAGPWQSVGEATPPRLKIAPPPPDVFRIAIDAPGKGREITAGNLVKLRILAGSGSLRDAATRETLQSAELWVWTGNVEALENDRVGGLGAGLLRAPLVNLREGARLSVFVDPHRITLSLPRRGFLLSFAYKSNWRQLIPSGAAAALLDKDYVELLGKGDYEIQVERVCAGSVTRKQALLKQWGYVFNWGDMHYAVAREGVLERFAMEGICGPSGEKVRFEKGPAYGPGTPGYREKTLLNWEESYESAGIKPGIF